VREAPRASKCPRQHRHTWMRSQVKPTTWSRHVGRHTWTRTINIPTLHVRLAALEIHHLVRGALQNVKVVSKLRRSFGELHLSVIVFLYALQQGRHSGVCVLKFSIDVLVFRILGGFHRSSRLFDEGSSVNSSSNRANCDQAGDPGTPPAQFFLPI
jgi:hypothetical protein